MVTIYRKCSKCGSKVKIQMDKYGEDHIPMCMQPFPARISGICGGSYTIDLNEEEIIELEKTIN
jgi:hypothetical protein